MKQVSFDIAVIGAGMFGSGPDEPVTSKKRLHNDHLERTMIKPGSHGDWANRFRTIEAESGISFFHECG